MLTSLIFPSYHQKRRCQRSGFALISCLLLSTLLVIVALASIPLAAKVSRATELEKSQAIARSNARLALQIAIAQLQKYCGRDLSLSCRSDQLDTRTHPTAKADSKILHPYFTLALQTERINQATATALNLRKIKGLPAVLISGNERYDLFKFDHYPAGYTQIDSPLDAANSVTLLAGENSSATASVRVPLVSVSKNGSYAYWVSDEGLKARINLPPSQREPAERAPTISSHPFLTALQNQPENREKLISLSTIGVHGELQRSSQLRHSHNFTTRSQSVLSDSKNGGLKKNLTATINCDIERFRHFTEHLGNESLHPSPVFLYKKWCFPSGRQDLSYRHYPGAPWELFRSYIRRPEFEPALDSATPRVLSHLGSRAHKLLSYWQSRPKGISYVHPLTARLIRRTPLLLRFQLGVDYSLLYLGEVSENDESWHEFEVRQHLMPLVIYWNPYDTDLEVSEQARYAIYAGSGWGEGDHNSHFRAHFPAQVRWKVLALRDNNSKQQPSWSTPLVGSHEYIHPFHALGNSTRQSRLNHYDFHLPRFTLAAGSTAVFALKQSHTPFDFEGKNRLEKVHKATDFQGNSFFTNHVKLRVSSKSVDSYLDAIPELELLSHSHSDSQAGCRIHATHTTTFQRTNWNFSKVVNHAQLRFTPHLHNGQGPLPASDQNGSESPKFAGVLIRKFSDISHYTGSLTDHSNNYLAPWTMLYNAAASRHGSCGADSPQSLTFATPPLYLSGILIGTDAFSQIQPELTSAAQAFVGYSDTFSGGSSYACTIALPKWQKRILNVAQLQQMNTSKWVSNYNADHSNASATDSLSPSFPIANSLAPAHIPPNHYKIDIYDALASSGKQLTTHYDQSLLYNETLWDRYFLTGIRAEEQNSAALVDTLLKNRHLTLLEKLDDNSINDPHLSANHFLQQGGFNVNSTSVEAWAAFLTEALNQRRMSVNSQQKKWIRKPSLDPSDKALYDGKHLRLLSREEVSTIAENIVIQNKLRGPSPTLSQWINRSLLPEHHRQRHSHPLTAGQVSYAGPLQTALDLAGVNGAFTESDAVVPLSLQANEFNSDDYRTGKVNPRSLKYHSGYGAPATITQADILESIGHFLSNRSDTFTVRAYGDARDSQGNVIARAYCEATIQRFPAYVNPADGAEVPPHIWQLSGLGDVPHSGSWRPNPQLSPLSATYGRRFRITSFRWLDTPD